MARWDGIDEFIEVVETGSFTAAAEKMGVSKSFISKQMKSLEGRFGARLLQRTTRQMTLTSVGEVFFGQCKKMADQFRLTESMVSQLQNAPIGSLKIALNATFGVRYMAEAIAEFSKQHPKLALEITAGYDDVDMTKGSYDLSIRYGGLEDSSHLIARKLGRHRLSLYASPEYLICHGVPKNPEDLKDHNCLVAPNRYWQLTKDGERQKMRVDGNWVSEDGSTLLMAAKKGLGIVQLPDYFTKKDLQEGSLVQIGEQWGSYSRVCWAVYPRSRTPSAKIRLFVNFLTGYMQDLTEKQKCIYTQHS